MTYAKIENNEVVEYPIYEGDLRLRFRNVSFPTPFQPPEGYARVEDAVPPEYDPRKNINEGSPTFSNGKLTRNWVVTPAAPDEVIERTASQWVNIRAKRNGLLRESDWTQIAGSPVSRAPWVAYRQALRDITKQTDPYNIIWPVEPV